MVFMSWLAVLWAHPVVQIGLGGALGANTRYWVTRVFVSWAERAGFPLATGFINVTGSFALGLAVVLCLKRLPSEQHHWYLLFGTGFCGGYTTFSTFSLEVFELLREGRIGLGLLYVFLSVTAGLGAVSLGIVLAEWLVPPRS